MLLMHKGKPGAGTERFAACSPEDLSMRGGGEQEDCPKLNGQDRAERAPLPSQGSMERCF